jgi:RNA recognition motif-containing protein
MEGVDKSPMNSIVNANLFVADIPFECVENDIYEIFRDYGKILKIDIVDDSILRYALLQFESVNSAMQAICELQDLEILGNPVK